MDLKEFLDEAAQAGPAHRPVADRVAAGRRAVRRRRARAAAGAAAGVAMAGTAWALAPGDSPSVVVADAPTTAPRAEPAASTWPSPDSWAAIDADGVVTVRGGVEVRQQLDDVVTGFPSAALDLARSGERRFVFLWVRENGVVTEVAEPGVGSFRDFVVDNQGTVDADLPIAIGTGGDYASLPLVAYRGGELWVVPGAEIVSAVADPVPGWCGSSPNHAVEIDYRGSTYFAALGEGNCGGSFGEARPDQTLDDFISTFASTQP